MEKNVNYTAAQNAIILAAAAAAGGTLNLEIAKSLAADPRMNHPETGEPRGYRSIVAKIGVMERSGEAVKYERKGPVTKDGKPVTKKTDLIGRIADLVGVQASKLDGMDKSPKLALETVVAGIAAVVAERDELLGEDGEDDAATGTDG